MAEAKVRRTFRNRMAFGLLGYSLALISALILQGYLMHEAVERAVWRSLLDAELDYLKQQHSDDPDFRWPQTETLGVWSFPIDGDPPRDLPVGIADLPVGFHDEVKSGSDNNAVMIDESGSERIVLVMNITEMENAEWFRGVLVIGSALSCSIALALLVWWLAGRLLRPIRQLVFEVDGLQPDARGQRVSLPDDASAEIETITQAMNGFLQRHEGYVDREKQFVDSVGHELRTPIAVIAGAVDVLDQRLGDDPSLRVPLQRIRQSATNVEQLIGLLLVLAKEPQRLRETSESFDLESVLADLVEDHQHLTASKALEMRLSHIEPTRLFAPIGIAHVAIGNLLRNAIENSDHGQIDVSVEPAGVVHVRDPGSGLSAEEIGRRYVERARKPNLYGAGLGLALIGRICGHLGWSLRFEEMRGRGTHAILDLRASRQMPT